MVGKYLPDKPSAQDFWVHTPRLPSSGQEMTVSNCRHLRRSESQSEGRKRRRRRGYIPTTKLRASGRVTGKGGEGCGDQERELGTGKHRAAHPGCQALARTEPAREVDPGADPDSPTEGGEEMALYGRMKSRQGVTTGD